MIDFKNLDKYRELSQTLYLKAKDYDKYELPLKKDGGRKTLFTLIGCDNVSRETIFNIAPELKGITDNVYEQISIESKYSGYMKRQLNDIEIFKKDENLKIRKDIDYSLVGGLSREMVAKLEKYRPETLGEASRISGVTPAAIIAILSYMKNN